jgi:hypothetical protein
LEERPVKRLFVIAAALACLAAAARAADDPALAAEKAAVQKVVQEAYVDGIHNFRRPDAVRKGFHPGFEMLFIRDGKLEKLPIYTWIQSIEEKNAKEPLPADAKATTTAAYPQTDVTGTVAVCKVELSREGKLVFTDYLLLYKFDDGWKIVGKAFHRH